MTKRLFAVFCSAWLLAAHGGSSTNYTSNPDSINSGGGAASSTSYTMRATVGQPFATGASSSPSYALKAGFLHMGPGGSLIQQATTTFNIVLEGAQEVPVNGSPATGSGTAVVDPNLNTITLNLTFSGLTSAVTMAHLHGPVARGVDGGIKIALADLTSPMSETVAYDEADEADILSGLWYVNIHTVSFGGGEVRGQLDNAGAAPRNLLTVIKAGSGNGTVTSDVGGIACGSTCAYNSPVGLVVTLNAAPSGGGTFTGWSGGGCAGNGACVVTMDAAKSVTATFTGIAQHTVTPSAGSGGTLSPGTPQTVNHGATTSFTVTPNAGFAIASVMGCGGSLGGSTYTTGPITADCTVTASFVDTNPPRLGNISTRMQVLTGNDVMIGGFVIGGASSKTVAIVATGPSLAQFGISNPLANPTLRLVRSSDQSVIATNDDWQGGCPQGSACAMPSQLSAAGFAPSDPLEAAMLVTLAPGAYTAIVEGVGGGTGVSVIGVYEVDVPTIPLINISTRGRVQAGNDVMIGGFVIQGSGPQTLAIVATGPSLAAFGIDNPLANPRITLVRSSDQAVIDSNDDWQLHSNASQLQAAGFSPSDALEAGIHTTLPPGAYTVIVEGAGGGTGVAVIGVYKVN
jgi:hypothetical protein